MKESKNAFFNEGKKFQMSHKKLQIFVILIEDEYCNFLFRGEFMYIKKRWQIYIAT